MAFGQQMAIEQVIRMVELGEIPAEDQNIHLVRLMGVRLMIGRCPKSVRDELLRGVKEGKLNRLPKKGAMPEAFFHPNAKAIAIKMRNEKEYETKQALLKCCG